MVSVGMAIFFVLVVAVANFLMGFALAAKLGLGPKDWTTICSALAASPSEELDSISSQRENEDFKAEAHSD